MLRRHIRELRCSFSSFLEFSERLRRATPGIEAPADQGVQAARLEPVDPRAGVDEVNPLEDGPEPEDPRAGADEVNPLDASQEPKDTRAAGGVFGTVSQYPEAFCRGDVLLDNLLAKILAKTVDKRFVEKVQTLAAASYHLEDVVRVQEEDLEARLKNPNLPEMMSADVVRIEVIDKTQVSCFPLTSPLSTSLPHFLVSDRSRLGEVTGKHDAYA